MYLSCIIGFISAIFSFPQVLLDSNVNGIDKVYSILDIGKRPASARISGNFESLNAGSQDEKQVYTLKGGRKYSLVRYVNLADENLRDYFIWNNNKINVSHEFDPATIEVHTLNQKGSYYVVFIARAESASGSGVQVSYFIVSKLDKSGHVSRTYEFESRFGNIHALIELKNKGGLFYYKVKNGDKMGNFDVTINRVEGNTQVTAGKAEVRYDNNDKFMILSNDLKLSTR